VCGTGYWYITIYKHKEIAHTLIALWFTLEMDTIETDVTDQTFSVYETACLSALHVYPFVRPSVRLSVRGSRFLDHD